MLTEIAVEGPLTSATRARLAAALAGAEGPVLLVLGSEGLPLDNLGQPGPAGELAALAADIAAREGSVALLGGTVRGAALELALAATHRVAEAGADMALDDLSYALVPVAGATQRLPRLVGAEAALDLLLQGRRVTALQALAMGLVDHVAEGDARQLAQRLAGTPEPPRRGLRDGRRYLAALSEARRKAQGAAARAVDCVEMALLLPAEQGLAFERVCFTDLCTTEAALGHLHAARAFARATGPVAPVGRIGLWGGGAAAVALAEQALRAGLTVQFAAPERDDVVRTLADLAEAQAVAVAAGQLTAEEREADWARLLPQVGPEGVAGVDLAVMLQAGVAQGPRLAMGFAAPPGAMGLTRFDDLAEIQPNGAAPVAVARAAGFAQAMGWQPVVTGQGTPVALRLAKALSDAVLWAEGQGQARGAIARALAVAGLAGGQAVTGQDETALRCLAALANAGARAIAAGEAPSAAHVDAVAIAAGLMSRETGGPMHQANRRGLLVLRRDLRLWQAGDAALWSPAPLIDDLVAEGRPFT